MWKELSDDEDPGVAWYLELDSSSLRSDDDEDDEDDEVEPDEEPDAPLETFVVAAMIEPRPTNAARLMAAVTMRARRAGCRRRRRGRGARSAGTGTSITDALARSLKSPPVTVLRDPWAGS
ncbi:MAG TPA: hypothetical protein VFA62_08645 [Acidimicrobiia bacterium]|nr:hypothetical protein [Acidimicrobiia bacterium]